MFTSILSLGGCLVLAFVTGTIVVRRRAIGSSGLVPTLAHWTDELRQIVRTSAIDAPGAAASLLQMQRRLSRPGGAWTRVSDFALQVMLAATATMLWLDFGTNGEGASSALGAAFVGVMAGMVALGTLPIRPATSVAAEEHFGMLTRLLGTARGCLADGANADEFDSRVRELLHTPTRPIRAAA
jgi:hypothetical protein